MAVNVNSQHLMNTIIYCLNIYYYYYLQYNINEAFLFVYLIAY